MRNVDLFALKLEVRTIMPYLVFRLFSIAFADADVKLIRGNIMISFKLC